MTISIKKKVKIKSGREYKKYIWRIDQSLYMLAKFALFAPFKI
jgi:hypothetical protein